MVEADPHHAVAVPDAGHAAPMPGAAQEAVYKAQGLEGHQGHRHARHQGEKEGRTKNELGSIDIVPAMEWPRRAGSKKFHYCNLKLIA